MNDDEAISTLLIEFAAAMLAWESRHAPLINTEFDSRSGKAALRMEEAQIDLCKVFEKYCVDATNPERRGSAGDPPDYHPDYFDVLEIKVKGKKATAKVRQPRLGRMAPNKGGGIVPVNTGKEFILYHLRLTDGVWRLEDRRESQFDDGTVIKMGL